jgi:hypothetical protein
MASRAPVLQDLSVMRAFRAISVPSVGRDKTWLAGNKFKQTRSEPTNLFPSSPGNKARGQG